MLPTQTEVEDFLLTDVVVGLSNIRAHLEWARAGPTGDRRLSRDGTAIIISSLLRIENKANDIAERLIGRKREEVGVTATLRRFRLDGVA